MSISKTEDVFALVKSLSKAEKRAFRLFAERIQDSEALAYMQLFDILDKQKVLNEDLVKLKLKVSPNKYSNLKRHLHEQLLISLRHISKHKKPNIRTREYIDFAYVLYGKGLHLQALKILTKAKNLAIKNHNDFSLLTILEFEKMIHSRHITRTKSKPVQLMMEESLEKVKEIHSRVEHSNLRMELHKFYIEEGHVKNETEETYVKNLFAENLHDIKNKKSGLMETIHLNQAYVWYYYILNDFKNCFKHAEKWIQQFQRNTELQSRDSNLYLRGYHYLLTSAYNLKRRDIYKQYLNHLEDFRNENYSQFNLNTKILSFLYVHLGRMNLHFLQGTFEEGIKDIKKTLSRLERYKTKLDEHKVMIFHYKIAWMYIGNAQPDKSIKYLQSIINMTNISLRKDIQAYARLLFLMAHYDLGNNEILPSILRSYKSFFEKHEIKNKVQLLIFSFFKEISNAPLLEVIDIQKKYLKELKVLENNKFEKRAFLYLDSVSWFESKTKRQSIAHIIQAKIKR